MTLAAAPLTPKAPQEQPHLFTGLTWREFKATEQLLGQPGYRISFLDGTLEIQKMPGELHESFKERIAALLELFLLMAGFDFKPTGSMTLENESRLVKREADKSYKLSPTSPRPDLVIEVVFSSGGVEKLEAYKRLKIDEVWFWEDGVLDMYHLRGSDDGAYYEKIEASEAVPGLDVALLKRCILMANHVEALKMFQANLSAS